MVSASCEHNNTHGPWLCKPCRCNRSEVQHLPCRMSQKNRYLLDAHTFQSSLALGIEGSPRNRAEYAEREEYRPEEHQRHSNLSGVSDESWTCYRMCKYWVKTCTVSGPTISWMHASLVKVDATVLRPRRQACTTWNSSGASSTMDLP
jgi:hypothetical protein